MKCYNQQTFEKLGFDQILQETSRYAMSDEAKERILAIVPQSDPHQILPALAKVKEFTEILSLGEDFPLDAFVSISYIMRKLAIKDNWINQEELFRILRWLKGIARVQRFFRLKNETYPSLGGFINEISLEQGLIRYIDKLFDDKGNIHDNASPALKEIRDGLKGSTNELRSSLYRMLRRAIDNNWSVAKEITFRNDRLVIPIKAEAKRHVPGFVQDISQSGGTLYVEPTQALPLNNRVKELKIREHNEIIRILQDCSRKLHEDFEHLARFEDLILELEVLRAKAQLALLISAILPKIDTEAQTLKLDAARYPLLLLKAGKDPKEVIPLSLLLDAEQRILLVSGPNAGGKSVALKTVGLLQVMLQSGFLVPAQDGSVFRFFDSLFLDLGDEQSVANDLSTYTSHLYQMRSMGDNMNQNSLFLIDEFGSGTDPRMGGAIAEAFLERFVRQKAIGIITTHYGNLKEYAAKGKGIINGAMQFDTKELKPTYKLEVGIPGRSYAFEIAKRVGVHYTILSKAKKKMGSKEVTSERLLKELEKKTAEVNQLLSENRRKEKYLQKSLEEQVSRESEWKNKKKEILRQAKIEAKTLILDANKQIERTIKEIKEKNAEKKATLKLRAELAAAMPEPEPAPQPVEKSKKRSRVVPKEVEPEERIKILQGEPVLVGDWVKLADSESYGKLEELQGKKAVVTLGEMRLNVPLKQLVKVKMPKRKQTTKVNVRGNMPTTRARIQLDVMGMRVEKALGEVDKLVDDARLAGLPSVSILHGKGTGALREAIRKHLLDLPFIKSLEDAPHEMGGAGWTVVRFKE